MDVPKVKDDSNYSDRTSRMRFGKMMLFAGTAGKELASEIAAEIARKEGYKNFSVGQSETIKFSNENLFVKLNESVRGKDVYYVQTMASPIHENIMETLIMIDALKRDSAWRINLV